MNKNTYKFINNISFLLIYGFLFLVLFGLWFIVSYYFTGETNYFDITNPDNYFTISTFISILILFAVIVLQGWQITSLRNKLVDLENKNETTN